MGAFWNLIRHFKKYRVKLSLAISSHLLTALFTVVSIPLIIPFFKILFDDQSSSQLITDEHFIITLLKTFFAQIIVENGRETAVIYICGAIILAFFAKNLFRYLALFFMIPIRNGVIYDIRKQLYEKYLRLPISFHKNAKKGDLISRISTDVQEVEWSMLNVVEAIFKAPFVILGSVTLMLLISIKLTAFVFILLVFTVFVIGTISKTLKRQSSKAQESLANLSSLTEESLSGIKLIKGYNTEEIMISRFEQENSRFRTTMNALLRRRDLSSPLSEFLGVSVVAVLLWFGAIQVFSENITPEVFFAFVFAFYTVIEPAKSFAAAYYNIKKGSAALERIDNLLDIKQESSKEQTEDLSFTDKIVFRNVFLNYNKDEALKNIDLTIKKGDKIALVGSSGAGKTSLVDLLPRFYDPSAGDVMIDNRESRDLSLKSLRSLFSIVSQETVLFHDSILENIRFWDKKYSEDDVVEAAKLAYVDQFVAKMDNKYHTIVGDRGTKLSGGERQRISIARAILKDAPILILDEATSSLDTESEMFIQKALAYLSQEKTTITIAHRLSTVKNADMIIVLDGGEIVEMGDHKTLASKRGHYFKFLEKQSLRD